MHTYGQAALIRGLLFCSWSRQYLAAVYLVVSGCSPRLSWVYKVGFTHRPLSSSFLELPYWILNINHKKELLRGLWVGFKVLGSSWQSYASSGGRGPGGRGCLGRSSRFAALSLFDLGITGLCPSFEANGRFTEASLRAVGPLGIPKFSFGGGVEVEGSFYKGLVLTGLGVYSDF